MFEKYLITGATGFLGRAVINELMKENNNVTALVLKNDPFVNNLPSSVNIVWGDICDETSLKQFFMDTDNHTCVIHCAGIVSVASHPGERIYRINVGGTNNIIRYCEKYSVGKLVYVSSVHAIPEKPKNVTMDEDVVFSPEKVRGDYAKSKAIATSLVFEAAKRGLNASVVYPSGIIGPGDIGKGSITNMLISYLFGKMPFAVKGGYDFVDVRDVAAGIISCAKCGEPGRGYILSGNYATIRDLLNLTKTEAGINRSPLYLPFCLAKFAAPFIEKRSLRKQQPLYFTPYSIAVLKSNGKFSRKAAELCFGYSPRSLQQSIGDMVKWIYNHVMCPVRRKHIL
ncbi:NAD-dependent epimerase/dehydratase family protein [bacterium]|nr:NAD-dependent epimerase/dehydratase family protein [bacterium]